MKKLKTFSLLATSVWVASQKTKIDEIKADQFVSLPAALQRVDLCEALIPRLDILLMSSLM
jgi:hypothetical protein